MKYLPWNPFPSDKKSKVTLSGHLHLRRLGFGPKQDSFLDQNGPCLEVKNEDKNKVKNKIKNKDNKNTQIPIRKWIFSDFKMN